jgi:tetratricopeptide (TPR) repeat protein
LTTLIASTAERNRQKRQLVEQAVKLAMANDWQQAVDVNRQIIELTPDEPDAWNRLGKAMSELGQYADARDAYQEALNRDANNNIAIKQVKRLSLLADAMPSSDTKRVKLDAKLLIEETGKTGIFELVSPARAPILARTAPGDKVELHIDGSDIEVKDSTGERLGQLPPKIAVRLIELMKGGNDYVAGITNVSERHIRVLVREVRQAPEMDGRVSFPSRGGPLPPELRSISRPDRAIRFEADDDDFTADDADDENEEAEVEAEETTSDIEYYEDSESSSPADQ